MLELGLVLTLAVGAGWLAAPCRPPRLIRYLAVGLLVSPFTPGYLADAAWIVGTSAPGAALIGLSIALSSSIVVVNITRSRRLTTSPRHRRGDLRLVQDMTGVAIALLLVAGLA